MSVDDKKKRKIQLAVHYWVYFNQNKPDCIRRMQRPLKKLDLLIKNMSIQTNKHLFLFSRVHWGLRVSLEQMDRR